METIIITIDQIIRMEIGLVMEDITAVEIMEIIRETEEDSATI